MIALQPAYTSQIEANTGSEPETARTDRRSSYINDVKLA